MEIINLPSGGTALLREPKAVTERARRPITRLNGRIAAGQVGELLRRKGELSDDEFEAEATRVLATDDWELLDEVSDLMIVALVAEWSHDAPITSDGVLDIPIGDYEALKAETAKHVNELLPDFTPNPEPDSPTAPSHD